MNVGDFVRSAEITRKLFSDTMEVVIEVLTFALIFAFWLKQIVCPGSYIRSPVICVWFLPCHWWILELQFVKLAVFAGPTTDEIILELRGRAGERTYQT